MAYILFIVQHNIQFQLGQSEENVWRNMLSRICQSIGLHFKRSVENLILNVPAS